MPRSLGVPSKPPLSLSAVEAEAYGLDDVSETGVGVGAGGGVGALRTLAWKEHKYKYYQNTEGSTLIEANFGCIGLYLSFLDCGAGVVVSSRSGWAVIFRPVPC